MLENDIQRWTVRLESVSAIVQRGCVSSGVPDAGELLLDMIIELLQAIPRIDEPLPEPGEESPTQPRNQDRGSLPSSLSRGEVSAVGILELRRSSPLPPPHVAHKLAQPEIE